MTGHPAPVEQRSQPTSVFVGPPRCGSLHSPNILRRRRRRYNHNFARRQLKHPPPVSGHAHESSADRSPWQPFTWCFEFTPGQQVDLSFVCRFGFAARSVSLARDFEETSGFESVRFKRSEVASVAFKSVFATEFVSRLEDAVVAGTNSVGPPGRSRLGAPHLAQRAPCVAPRA